MAGRPDRGHDHRVDPAGDVRTDRDADLLAGLPTRRRGPGWLLVIAVVWAALAIAQITVGTRWVGIAYLVLAAGQAWAWWTNPQARVRAVTADALLLRQGLRTLTVSRDDLVDVHPRHTGAYGLELSVRGGKRIRLVRTASRFSVAEAQAAALRRWAGMDR